MKSLVMWLYTTTILLFSHAPLVFRGDVTPPERYLLLLMVIDVAYFGLAVWSSIEAIYADEEED